MGLLHHPMEKTTFRANEGVDFFIIQPEHGGFDGGVYLCHPLEKFVAFAVGTAYFEAGQHVLNGMQGFAHIFF